MLEVNDLEKGLKIAKEKHAKYKNIDPFIQIAPALLNRADITDYVRETGMIYPFYEEDLKPATYALRIKGDIVTFDDNNIKHTDQFDERSANKPFCLKKNSIAFVSLEPYLQIPNYLVARFNLKIDHVYKGLLLGTGPIIDPGYHGYLSLPLHNLTNNDYYIDFRERLIWMEFTKLSENSFWEKYKKKQHGVFEEYVFENERNVHDFVSKSNKGNAIISSMKGLESSMNKFESRVVQAEGKVDETFKNNKELQEKTTNNVNRINLGIIFSAAGFLSVLAAVVSIFSNWFIDYKKDIKDLLNNKVEKYKYDELVNDLKSTKFYYELHKKDSIEIQNLKKDIEELRRKQK